MSLKFFGRGSGFSDEHTSAYFSTKNNELILIDCPVQAFHKLKHFDLQSYRNLYVLITHTHGDHIGGLGLLVQYAFFVLKKSITIVAPSFEVAQDISTLLTIEGNLSEWYNLTLAIELKEEWFCNTIPTKHAPQLENKCFGYRFNIDGINVVYTGDTSTLEPFIPYLDENSILYVDTSMHYNMVHLNFDTALDDFLTLNKKGVKIYLMHLDDISTAEKKVENYPNINVVCVS